MDDKTYRRMMLSCQCGMSFKSMAAEARHRHNFPALCRRSKVNTYRPTNKAAYAVPCPFCKVEIGKPCHQIKNPERWISSHAKRIEVACKAKGWFQLSDGRISNHDASPGDKDYKNWKEVPL